VDTISRSTDYPCHCLPEEITSYTPIGAYALVSSLPVPGSCLWDLYDSGASHHMSPCREDFLSYQEIKPKPLSAVNKEVFMANGIGDIIITVPNGEVANRIRLTGVLYTPSTAFTLISVRRIDDAGYYMYHFWW
jgi:hypothetical protein